MAATWALVPDHARSTRSVQAATEAAPSTPLEGMSLVGIASVSVWVEAAAGQSFTSDAGQLDMYQYDAGQWGVYPGGALLMPPSIIGLRRACVGAFTVEVPRGRIAPTCNGLHVSGGNVTVELLATVPSAIGPVGV